MMALALLLVTMSHGIARGQSAEQANAAETFIAAENDALHAGRIVDAAIRSLQPTMQAAIAAQNAREENVSKTQGIVLRAVAVNLSVVELATLTEFYRNPLVKSANRKIDADKQAEITAEEIAVLKAFEVSPVGVAASAHLEVANKQFQAQSKVEFAAFVERAAVAAEAKK